MITINIDKAREIAHAKRREARAVEFAPLDEIIAKQIPGKDAKDVERQRQAVREKYAKVQASIDKAATVVELTAVVVGI